jgi:hypothetical protein
MKQALLLILILLAGCSSVPEVVKNITTLEKQQQYITLMLIADEDMGALFNGKTYMIVGNTIEKIPNVLIQDNYTIVTTNENSYATTNICGEICRLKIDHKGKITRININETSFILKFDGDVRDATMCNQFIGDVWWIGMNAEQISDNCYRVKENITYELRYKGNGSINSTLFT